MNFRVEYICSAIVTDSQHVQVPIPTPKKNEVLLKLEAASLNPGDCKIQKGQARPIFPRKLPHIPVTDVAGEVVELGEDVKNFKVGDKVVAMLSYGYGGGLGEFAAANAEMVVARPSEVSAADGAGLPVAALSAHWALTKDAEIKLDGTDEPKNILITGASGNVGLYAVQLAKLGNAHVTATCGALTPSYPILCLDAANARCLARSSVSHYTLLSQWTETVCNIDES
ncbi:hypothetical protein ACLB2K_047345 [Fragaria x ananassa]